MRGPFCSMAWVAQVGGLGEDEVVAGVCQQGEVGVYGFDQDQDCLVHDASGWVGDYAEGVGGGVNGYYGWGLYGRREWDLGAGAL